MSNIIPKRHVQLRELRHGAYDGLAQQLKRGSAPSSSAAYEKALAKLGNTILMEQAPELMPYMLGFQLLDKSDEGDFAAGFFIFDLAGAIVDCPVFLIDGKLKGYQLLNVRSQGLFLPLLGEVVNYVLSKQDEALGYASYGENENRSNRLTTNFDVYSNQNKYLQKVSGVDIKYPTHFDSWSIKSGALESFLGMLYCDRTQELTDSVKKTASLPDPGWESLLEDKRVATTLWGWCSQSPKFASKIASMLGSDWADKLNSYYDQRRQYIAKFAGFRADNERPLSIGSSKSSVPAEGTKLAAFTSLDSFRSDIDRESYVGELLKYGAAFIDDRECSKVAMAVVDVDERWSSPTTTGLYEVPLISGDKRKLLVVVPKDRLCCNGRESFLVDLSTKESASVISQEVAGMMQGKYDLTGNESVTPQTTGLSEFTASACGENDVIMLSDDKGKFVGPLRIRGGSDSTGYDIDFVSTRTQGSRSPYGSALPSPTNSGGSHSRPSKMAIKEDSSCIKVVDFGDSDDVLCVPSTGVKFIKLATDDVDEYSCELTEIKVMPFSGMDFASKLKQASFDILRPASGYVSISGKRLTDRTAAYHLMRSGLPKEAALDVIDKANGIRKYYSVVDSGVEQWQLASNRKVALQPLPMNRDPDFMFNQPSQPQVGQADGQFSVTEERPVRERITSDGMNMADTSQPPWSSENAPYSEARDSGATSGGGMPSDAQTDNTAIFTNSLFQSLVSNVNPVTDRERLLGGLMKTCDNCGRSLFLVYAHGDDYSDMYGKGDSDELESELLTVFEGAGKLLVSLLNKSVSATADLQMTSFVDS